MNPYRGALKALTEVTIDLSKFYLSYLKVLFMCFSSIYMFLESPL